MKTVVLIHPEIDFEENYPCSWIPFSILSIGSALPLDRFKVKLFDGLRTPREKIYKELENDHILLIGISIMTGGGQIGNGLEIARRLRRDHPEASIVFGGPHVNVLPEQTAECELADFVLSGPGQRSFAMLAQALDENRIPENIPGLYYKKDGRLITPPVPKACIPYLTPYNFDLIDSMQYIRYDSTISERTLNYIASQGCPYACRFCYECVYGKRYYHMQTQYVKRDLRLYRDKFGVDGIKFYDADFFVNRKNTFEIVEYLKKLGLKWAASIHPRDINNDLLEKISKSGCTRLLMGMESGSDRILHDIVNKKASAGEYLDMAKAVADHGLLGSYTFMIGFPTETREETEATFRLVRDLWALNVPIETKIHIFLPYPGTPLFEKSVEMGHTAPNRLEDWSGYNYYKAMTPWTSKAMEEEAARYTRMIDKNRRVEKHESV